MAQQWHNSKISKIRNKQIYGKINGKKLIKVYENILDLEQEKEEEQGIKVDNINN